MVPEKKKENHTDCTDFVQGGCLFSDLSADGRDKHPFVFLMNRAEVQRLFLFCLLCAL